MIKRFDIKKNIPCIGILICGYISYFLYNFTLINDILHNSLMKIDVFLRFSMATLLLVIFHMFIKELFKDFKDVDNINLYNQYYQSTTQSYNIVFKVTSEIIHNQLTKNELDFNLAILRKQKEYLESVEVPKKYRKNHLDIIEYINEILDTLN